VAVRAGTMTGSAVATLITGGEGDCDGNVCGCNGTGGGGSSIGELSCHNVTSLWGQTYRRAVRTDC